MKRSILKAILFMFASCFVQLSSAEVIDGPHSENAFYNYSQYVVIFKPCYDPRNPTFNLKQVCAEVINDSQKKNHQAIVYASRDTRELLEEIRQIIHPRIQRSERMIVNATLDLFSGETGAKNEVLLLVLRPGKLMRAR